MTSPPPSFSQSKESAIPRRLWLVSSSKLRGRPCYLVPPQMGLVNHDRDQQQESKHYWWSWRYYPFIDNLRHQSNQHKYGSMNRDPGKLQEVQLMIPSNWLDNLSNTGIRGITDERGCSMRIYMHLAIAKATRRLNRPTILSAGSAHKEFRTP